MIGSRQFGLVSSAIWAALLGAALTIFAPAGWSAEPPADIQIRVDATATATGEDPHPAFQERAARLLGDSAEALLAWGSFSGPTLASQAADPSAVLASRRDKGIAVFILNEGNGPKTYRVEVKLPRGLYGVESRMLPGTGDVQPRRSLALSEPGARAVTGTVDPRSVLAIRFSDLCAQARGAIAAISSYLAGSDIPDDRRRRIESCLKEPQWRIARVEKQLGKRDRADLAKEIHRGMLLASQADALVRNAALQGQLPKVPADRLDADLKAMQAALSAISAACFDIFPMVSVESPTDVTSPTMLVLSLVNRGTEPVSLINFAVHPPENWTATPIGYTLFARLGPGESLSSRFALGAPSDAAPGSSVGFPGEISYFSGHAAAHLDVYATVRLPDAR